MQDTKARVTVRDRAQKDVLVVRKSHYLRFLRRIEDLEDALTLDCAENSSKDLLDYAEVRKRLKRIGKL